MALLPCPECTQAVSSAAERCASCGYPLAEDPTLTERLWRRAGTESVVRGGRLYLERGELAVWNGRLGRLAEGGALTHWCEVASVLVVDCELKHTHLGLDVLAARRGKQAYAVANASSDLAATR